MSRIFYYTFIEPFTWLFYSLFRPATFARYVERYGIKMTAQRTVLMLRLALPMFLSACALTTIIRLFLYISFPISLSSCYLVTALCISNLNIMSLLSIAALNTVLGIAIGVVIGIAGSITLGLTIGLALGVALGAANALVGGVILGVTFGLVEGVILGTGESLLIFVALSIALGIVCGFTGGDVALGLAAGAAGGVTLSIARGITGNAKDSTWFRFIMGAITGSIGGGVVWLIAGEITWSVTKDISGFIAESGSGSLHRHYVYCLLHFWLLSLATLSDKLPVSVQNLYRQPSEST